MRWIFAVVSLIAANAHAADALWLGADDLRRELGGHTIKGYYTYNRVGFVEVYLADGRITYKDDIKADVGRWSVEQSTFCTFYDRINGGCWLVRRRSANCYEFFSASRFGDARPSDDHEPDARGARDGEQVSCDAWYGS